jgi:hypothetical protein
MLDRAKAGLAFLLLLIAASGLPQAPAAAQPGAQTPGLTPFANAATLRAFLRSIVAEQRRENREAYGSDFPPPPPPPPPPAPPPPPPPGAASAPAALNITNTQVAGVDEGDIVKQHGQTLVILRRGRLFTLSLAGGALRPVAAINAFPPGVDGRGDWYDEMLVAGDRVVVIGYSYARGGTQVNRFHIDDAGALSFEDSYQLRSGDYYSTRNYASRLIGNRLILYSPIYLSLDGDVFDALPALRQWQAGAAGGGWRRIASATHVYVPNVLRDVRLADLSTLHGVTSCDLAAAALDCDATVVIGNSSRSFFVSNNAIYLWIGSVWKQAGHRANSFVYRIPFDGGRPSAVQARGMPVDQFSFHPDAARSALEVVVRAEGGGDAMWRPEATSGDTALLSIPMAAFGTGAQEVPLGRYRDLPKPHGNGWDFHNRFVGDYLLYGSGGNAPDGAVTTVSLADGNVREIPTAHDVDRLDAIGGDAIVIGSGRGFLGFTTIDLAPAGASVGETFRLANAREGETRSHAFFFHPDPESRDGGSGILGLPVAKSFQEPGRPYPGDSAAMLFLTRRGGRLAEAGELAARTTAGSDSTDGCQASCVDWYGNARPIFLENRIFALLGYELVEGARRGDRVGEIGRVNFAPAPPPRPAPGH